MKAVLDKEINTLRDKNKSVAITTTDLTAAFDTCNSIILTTMMEHIGIRGIELEILTTYLTNRNAKLLSDPRIEDEFDSIYNLHARLNEGEHNNARPN